MTSDQAQAEAEAFVRRHGVEVAADALAKHVEQSGHNHFTEAVAEQLVWTEELVAAPPVYEEYQPKGRV